MVNLVQAITILSVWCCELPARNCPSQQKADFWASATFCRLDRSVSGGLGPQWSTFSPFLGILTSDGVLTISLSWYRSL